MSMDKEITGTIVKEFSLFATPHTPLVETPLLIVYLTDNRDHTLLQVEMFGIVHKINADWLPEDRIEWFATVWARQLYETTKYGIRLATRRIYDAHKNFIDTLEGRITDG